MGKGWTEYNAGGWVAGVLMLCNLEQKHAAGWLIIDALCDAEMGGSQEMLEWIDAERTRRQMETERQRRREGSGGTEGD